MKPLVEKKLKTLVGQLLDQLLDTSLTKEEFVSIRSRYYRADYELFYLIKRKKAAKASVKKCMRVITKLAA